MAIEAERPRSWAGAVEEDNAEEPKKTSLHYATLLPLRFSTKWTFFLPRWRSFGSSVCWEWSSSYIYTFPPASASHALLGLHINEQQEGTETLTAEQQSGHDVSDEVIAEVSRLGFDVPLGIVGDYEVVSSSF
ncbi:hypothetical protein AOLI_G00141110 [Acnodon oligacanthus]